jgi:rRNA processing protein Gar1
MNVLKKIFGAIAQPFVAVICLIGTSQEINEDGSWDKYWARKNRRAMKKGERK